MKPVWVAAGWYEGCASWTRPNVFPISALAGNGSVLWKGAKSSKHTLPNQGLNQSYSEIHQSRFAQSSLQRRIGQVWPIWKLWTWTARKIVTRTATLISQPPPLDHPGKRLERRQPQSKSLAHKKKKNFLMLELNFLGCSPNVGTGIQTDVQGQLRQVNGAVCSHATRTPFRICASSSRARQSY